MGKGWGQMCIYIFFETTHLPRKPFPPKRCSFFNELLTDTASTPILALTWLFHLDLNIEHLHSGPFLEKDYDNRYCISLFCFPSGI